MMGKLIICFVFFFNSIHHTYSRSTKLNDFNDSASGSKSIKGYLPGWANGKLHINYFTPTLGGIKYKDSCMVDSEGHFEFRLPLNNPVLATIWQDNLLHTFDFVADTSGVLLVQQSSNITSVNKAIQAVSPLNDHYKKYKLFVDKEYRAADSIYSIRDRLIAEKKRDSVKLVSPSLEIADSLLFLKNVDFISENNEFHFVKSYVLYRKVMLRLDLEKVRELYEKIGLSGKESVYGKAIIDFIYSKKGLKVGSPPPDFANQKNQQGKIVSLKDFRGKYLLIDFWGSWCVPCRSMNPSLIKLYNRFHAKGFEILGVALEKERSEWLNAIHQDKLLWTQVSDLKFWDSESVKLYGLYSLPFKVLLDREGNIVAVNPTLVEVEKDLEIKLRQ